MKTYKAGIIGATGYTGSELVRILHHHPDVTIEVSPASRLPVSPSLRYIRFLPARLI